MDISSTTTMENLSYANYMSYRADVEKDMKLIMLS